VTISGDTRALPRIPVPGVEGALPTVALTLTPAAHPAEVPVEEPAEVSLEEPAASPEQIYEEAMAAIDALARDWSSTVRVTGRHRAAA
jgi:hypothetical protein